jgi:hypothetical protein
MSEPPVQAGPIPTAEQKFVGALLMAVGGLMATLCGLCTLGFVGLTIVDTVSAGTRQDFVVGFGVFVLFACLIGGVPTLFGAIIFYGGWKMRNPRK